jgi:hypothetical protein
MGASPRCDGGPLIALATLGSPYVVVLVKCLRIIYGKFLGLNFAAPAGTEFLNEGVTMFVLGKMVSAISNNPC